MSAISRRWILFVVVLFGAWASYAAAGPVAAIGAVGDSYSDEYQFYPPDRSTARNFIEILAQTRGLNFGAFTTASRGEPRNQGYAFNWARSGATSDDAVAKQLPGLASQVAGGQVNVASVFVGGNDILDLFAGGQLSPTNAVGQIQAAAQHVGANVTTLTQTLLAASPTARVVVATLPDLAKLPIAQTVEKEFPIIAPLVTVASQAMQALNAQIRASAAANPRVAVVDVDALFQDLLTRPTLTVGGLTIDRTTPGDSPTHLFLNDGLHAGTVGQGLLANAFVNAIDTKFGFNIAPLSGTEIAAVAESAAGGGSSSSVPLPAALWAGLLMLPIALLAGERGMRALVGQ